MPTELHAETLLGHVEEVVESVFATMMGLETDGHPVPWFPAQDRLTAAVNLSGDWNGTVLVECDRGQACRFAGRFLSVDPPGNVDDDVRDVLGELANMIGGNLKCLLTPGMRLSSPSVVDGSDCRPPTGGVEVLDRLAFRSSEGPFWVSVLATHSSEPAPGTERPMRTRGVILLVEDDELVRNMIVNALSFLGYAPEAAANGQQAIEVCGKLTTPIDLVISDVVMPDMKGMELRDQLVQLRPGLRVLFMSGYTTDVIARHGVLGPDVHFIQKPFSIDALKARIEEILV